MADEAPEVSGGDGAAQVVDPPPKGTTKKERTARPRRESRATVRVKPLETRLLEFFGEIKLHEETQTPYLTGLAGGIGIFNPADGQVIAMNSPNMAKAWANLADQNERVRRYLEYLLSGGAWGEVFVATTPVIFAIAMNHGMVPSSLFGPFEVADDGGVPQDGTGSQGTGQDGSVGRVPPGVS